MPPTTIPAMAPPDSALLLSLCTAAEVEAGLEEVLVAVDVGVPVAGTLNDGITDVASAGNGSPG